MGIKAKKAMQKRMRGDGGFTLVELLIVIVILGILAAIVVFAVGGITDKGKASACKSDVKTIETAEEAYFAKNGTYTDMPGLVTAKLLRQVPSTTNYTISVDATTGAVTSAPLCTTL
jgi:prepilin-type N-terminal cleavage/methylation domain-containing protein